MKASAPDLITMAEPSLEGNEIKYVTDCIKTNWISSKGKYVEKFEKDFSRYCGMKYGVAVSNGTTALHLALVALSIKEGDEVIIPDLTFAATANAVLYCGAKPVLVDVDEKTWCLNANKLEKLITKKTRAIIPVHLYGVPCNMDALRMIAKKNNLFIIEDCAEAHGVEFKGKKVGSFGDISCFSFYGNKIITTGEGGMCLTNNPLLAEKMRVLRDHGMNKEKRYWHDEVGYNYRLTNIQAAIGVAQLERVDEIIKKRIKINQMYTRLLSQNKKVILPFGSDNESAFYWMYSMVLKREAKISRDDLIKLLSEQGIESRPFFFPLHRMPPYFVKDGDDTYPTASKLSDQGISLPSYTNLDETKIKRICETINQLLL